MADGHEPFRSDPTAGVPAMPEGVPLGRPITVPYARPARLWGHDILLLDSSRLAALADIGALILMLLVLEILSMSALGLYLGWHLSSLDMIDPDLERALRVPGLAFRASAAFIAIAVILAFRRQSAGSVGVTRSGLGLNLIIGLGAVYGAYILIVSTMLPLWFLVPEVRDQMGENAERLMDLLPKMQPVGFAAVAMLVGIYEELLFRGFLMTRLRRATGSWTLALLFSTAVFTALHSLEQTAPALLMIAILSIVFSLVTIWRRSIIPAVIAHGLFDLSQFLLMYFTAGDSWT